MNCCLEKLDLRFAEDLARIIGDKKVQDNLRNGIPYPYTAADAKDFITFATSTESDFEYIFAITFDKKFVGCISATRGQNIHCRTAEIGYYVDPNFWGRGLAACAIRQLCDFIFAETDIIRVYAEPFARNIASCRALEKAGFEFEGTLHSNAVKNGIIEDMKMYCKISDKI